MIQKLNIGLSISKNFNKITLEVLEEPIESNGIDDFKEKIRGIFDVLKAEIEEEYKKLENK